MASGWQVHGVCRTTSYGRRKQQQQQQYTRPKQVAVVQNVVISDTMTVRDLAQALSMSPAALDGKLVDLGEIVESAEDMYAPFTSELQSLPVSVCMVVGASIRCFLLACAHTDDGDNACALQSFSRCSGAGSLGHGLRVHGADLTEWHRCTPQATCGHDRGPC